MQRQTIPRRHGMWFHVFVTNPDNPDKRGYIGCFTTEDSARQAAVEAVGIEGDYTIFPSIHQDSSVAKQEFRFRKFRESGDLWKQLKPMRNIRQNKHG